MNENLVLLYVEDEISIREEMIEILELDFNTIHVATNGQEGLQLYKKCTPHIVISDIQMPIMDGISMSKEILAYDKNAQIILVTAFNEKGYLNTANQLGIKAYINKPIDINELFRTITKLSESL
ncbi:response regulator [Sulfurimonas sp. MAG313]|nr:response regulator [Sulfurimonas sp. MAG313]MDF1880662.1 response regulator [Sulfurimonas sp. MAG313]